MQTFMNRVPSNSIMSDRHCHLHQRIYSLSYLPNILRDRNIDRKRNEGDIVYQASVSDQRLTHWVIEWMDVENLP